MTNYQLSISLRQPLTTYHLNTKIIYTAIGQTIWDVAAEQYGNLEGIIQLQEDNASVIIDFNVVLIPGTPLIIQVSDPVGIDGALRKMLNDAGVKVNSHEAYVAPSGIGYWAIDEDFIIQ